MAHPTDVSNIIIVGAGLAGLFAALKLAPAPVTVIAAERLGRGASSNWAQGGIAAAVGPGDTPQAHADDTIISGAGIVNEAVARMVAKEAGDRVHDLLAYGVPFDKDLNDALVLSREAAHSAKRVVRVAGDGAGRAIMAAVIATVQATPSIQLLEDFSVTGLRAETAKTWQIDMERADDPAATYTIVGATACVLATGGIGALYGRSTNPPVARGNGIALAAQVGAAIADSEFVQFHPTAIDVDVDPIPLATEALRGEGAILINAAGDRFMSNQHPDAELGPRDVVARGVYEELRAGRGAFLDCRAAIGDDFSKRFPSVYRQCMTAGIDPGRQPIPVVPAEHYHMGGVKTDMQGRSNVDGLWAIGESACTSLHGGNRLASNSLLEAVVFGARAAADVATSTTPHRCLLRREKTKHLPDSGVRNVAMELIRTTMSENAGVVRDEAGLRDAGETLLQIEGSADGDPVIQNAAIAARFVVEAALRRKESRGAHFRADFPRAVDEMQKSRAMTLAGLNLRNTMHAQDILQEIHGITDQGGPKNV